MGNCKNCAYWKRYDHTVYKRLGNCLAWRGGDGEGGYGWGEDEIPDNGVVVETDEGWGAYTGPEFGCVLFKERE